MGKDQTLKQFYYIKSMQERPGNVEKQYYFNRRTTCETQVL